MSDKKKNQQDEYQFPDEEYASEQSGGEDTTQFAAGDVEQEGGSTQAPSGSPLAGLMQRFQSLKNKRPVYVLAGVVVVLIMFQLMSSSKTKATPVVTQAQPVAPVQQPTAAQTSQMRSLSQAAMSTESAQHHLSDEIAALQNTVATEDQKNESMRKAILALADQMQTMQKQINALVADSKRIGKNGQQIVVYHLSAVVPGRAWLRGSDGSTQSVSVGDVIAHYGTVQQISVSPDRVVTSSGRVIQYNAEGN